MFKSDAEVEELLNHTNNRLNVNHRGNGQGQNPNSGGHASDDGKSYQKIPLEDKAKIGTLAALIGSRNTSELTGISETRVGQFRRGMNGSKPDEKLRAELTNRKSLIQEKALSKADTLLELVDADRMSGMDTVDMITSAEKMINIYDKLGPKIPGIGSAVQINFYAPKLRDVSEIPTIEVEPTVN